MIQRRKTIICNNPWQFQKPFRKILLNRKWKRFGILSLLLYSGRSKDGDCHSSAGGDCSAFIWEEIVLGLRVGGGICGGMAFRQRKSGYSSAILLVARSNSSRV